MIPFERNNYNTSFTAAKYEAFLKAINQYTPGGIQFRLAETPIFIDKNFRNQIVNAGNSICEQLLQKQFRELTDEAIPKDAYTPNESTRPNCIVIDFAIAKDQEGNIIPKLIELQGFPSLFGFEVLHDETFRSQFNIPLKYNCYLNGYDKTSYTKFLKDIVLGTQGKHTVLLELFPHQQKTNIDFYYTEKIIGLPIVCVSEIYVRNHFLCYNREGKEYIIQRIYNRIVLDELKKQSAEIQNKGALLQEVLNVEWVTHPHHFFRYSKFSIPFLKGPSIPFTQFLHQVQNMPKDLENYILKPLFSFAGQGVIIDLDESSIQAIPDPENWILQEKVDYAPVIETPSGFAKAEIRLFYFWDESKNEYVATNNLARLSKGKMIGVNYNQTATWVGGSLAYFET
jgi:hypothetical protein